MALPNLSNFLSNPYTHIKKAFFISVVMSPTILPGITLGYTAVALPQLDITIDEASWFSSLTLIGGPFGFIISRLLTDQLGRKLSLIGSIIPCVVGWYLLISDFSPGQTYFGRFLTGFTNGSSTHTVSTYLEETFMLRADKFSSRYITWCATAVAFGVCIVYTFGAMFGYKEVAVINLVISLTLILLISIFVPESPVWLYKNSRFGDADWSRLYLGLEFSDADFLSYNSFSVKVNWFSNLSCKNIVKIFSTAEAFKPIFVTTVLLSFSMLSGGLTLSTYMVNAIETRTFFKNSYQFAIIAGVLQLFISASISFILPYYGNRKLTLVSGSGLTIGMLVIALTTQMDYEPAFLYQIFIDRLHTLAVWFSISMFSIGFLTLPSVLLKEMFPRERPSLACIPIMVSFVINCIVIKMHLHMFKHYGGILYIFYAFMDAIGTYFVWILMPETTGQNS